MTISNFLIFVLYAENRMLHDKRIIFGMKIIRIIPIYKKLLTH